MKRFLCASALIAALYFLCNTVPAARAQFKEIGPAPFSPAVARQRIRTLLDQVEPPNRRETLDRLNGLTPWFRNILDEELIAGWKRDSRQRLTLVLEPLATEPVANGVVEFSWRQRSDATLNPEYAPLLEHLMTRYPRSGDAFLSDLLAPAPPQLSPLQVETVCRILIDMPDLGTWHQSALKILPHYRATAERLLAQDKQGGDQEKSYRAQLWMAELGGETSGSYEKHASLSHRPGPAPPSLTSSPSQQVTNPPPAPDPPRGTPLSAAPAAYSNGATSGTLECTGAPVPQNAEYVFRNLPPVRMQLDYDSRVWDARLAPGENQTQKLILRNKSSSPQKKCVVHWSAIP
jgi:hypothetical protein